MRGLISGSAAVVRSRIILFVSDMPGWLDGASAADRRSRSRMKRCWKTKRFPMRSKTFTVQFVAGEEVPQDR